MDEVSRGIILRYEPSGQFTFRHVTADATDEELFELAGLLNTFQDCEVDKVLAFQVLEV